MNILAFDCETSGFKPGQDRITEISAFLFEWQAPGMIFPLNNYEQLIWEPGFPKLSTEIQEITGITDELLESEGHCFEDALVALHNMTLKSPIDYFMAHNAAFDRGFFHAEMEPHLEWCSSLKQIPWICTLNDVQHPPKFKSRKLAHLALDYGCPVDPSKLHRAKADVDLMVGMLIHGRIDMKAVTERLNQPALTVRAMVPKPFGPQGDGGKGKDKAKACGFSWNGSMWIKEIRANELKTTEEELGYGVQVIKSSGT